MMVPGACWSTLTVLAVVIGRVGCVDTWCGARGQGEEVSSRAARRQRLRLLSSSTSRSEQPVVVAVLSRTIIHLTASMEDHIHDVWQHQYQFPVYLSQRKRRSMLGRNNSKISAVGGGLLDLALETNPAPRHTISPHNHRHNLRNQHPTLSSFKNNYTVAVHTQRCIANTVGRTALSATRYPTRASSLVCQFRAQVHRLLTRMHESSVMIRYGIALCSNRTVPHCFRNADLN